MAKDSRVGSAEETYGNEAWSQCQCAYVSVAFHIGVRSLLLLRDVEMPSDAELAKMKAPVNLFLSHAKADLDKERKGPVHRVLEESTELPIEYWYDAQNIDPAVEFTEPIKKGIRELDQAPTCGDPKRAVN